MSELEELEKRVYSAKKVSPNLDSEEGRKKAAQIVVEQDWRQDTKSWQVPQNKRKNWPLYIFIFLVLLTAGAYLYYGRQAFKKTDVALTISGPSEITSGDKISFRINYKNNSKVRLLNSSLTFKWPDDSEIIGNSKIDLGDIISQKEDVVSFEARVFGPKDSEKQIEAVLSYQPENLNAVLETKQNQNINIAATPIFLNFQMPSRAVSGKEFEFSLNYTNKSEANFSDLEIRFDYPSNFVSSNDFKYNLAKLVGKENGSIKIKGMLQGQEGDIYNFRVSIGIKKESQFLIYSQEQVSLQLSSALLWVFQTVQDTRDIAVLPGDVLNYKIRYKNTTDVAIANAILTVQFQTNILDFKTLDSPWSVFNSQTNTITWSSASLPDLLVLTPLKEGEVRFKVKVKDPPPVKTFNDKNFSIISTVNISAVSVPLSLVGLPLGNEDRLETKVNSKISFTSRGYYYDSPLSNSGPIPPKINQRTTYTLIWQIANYSDDVASVAVEAILPPYVEWIGPGVSFNENISYDKISGKVAWLIDKLSSGTGIISPAKQIAFQVAITPSFPQIDQALNLISDSTLTAQDVFTSQTLQASDQSINTALPDDPNMSYQKGRVVQ